MICQAGYSQGMHRGMLEVHWSALSTKIKPCLEIPWGQSSPGHAHEL